MKRESGILMPVSVLPSAEGIGGFGKESYEFLDIIKKCGFSIWQILPLNPLGLGYSPYQPSSSFAIDEIYISLESLFEEGLLDDFTPLLYEGDLIDYDTVRSYKRKYLKKSYEIFIRKKDADEKREYEAFKSKARVKQYAMYEVLLKKNNGKPWNEWKKEEIEGKVCDSLSEDDYFEYGFIIYVQYKLRRQWKLLRDYAHSLGIRIMGDLPFYAGFESDDVWKNKDQFLLGENYVPTCVGGVPPDFFSETGQRWGNPIYNWDKMKEDGFSWWNERISIASGLYDILRIDHFRALDTYWVIDASCPDATVGEWKLAPGYELLDTLISNIKGIEFVAEDLGYIREEVFVLRDYFDLPGMRIIQTSLFELDFPNDKENMCVYTGTHDNETLLSWIENLPPDKRKKIENSLGLFDEAVSAVSLADRIMQYTLSTNAKYAILPFFDVLNLGEEARINIPGTLGGRNWRYRLGNLTELSERTQFFFRENYKSNRVIISGKLL